MRATIIALLFLLSCVCTAQFQFEDGPWYAARVRDIILAPVSSEQFLGLISSC